IADTPNSEMNPMAAEILKFRLATYSPKIPPATANGMPASASRLSRTEANKLYRSIEIRSRLRGTMTASRFCASTNAPNSPVHSIALGQGKFFSDAILCLGHGRPEIASADAVLQRNKSLIVLPIDVGGAGLELHLAEVAQRNIRGRRFWIVVWQGDGDGANGVDIAAIFWSQANGERKIHLALIDPGHFLAAD